MPLTTASPPLMKRVFGAKGTTFECTSFARLAILSLDRRSSFDQ
jgi:hypothetical protein